MSGNAKHRYQISEENFLRATRVVLDKLKERREQKGDGILVSSHEILGILEEELYEFKKAVHEKTPTQYKTNELIDIAVAAIFGIASYRTEKMDW